MSLDRFREERVEHLKAIEVELRFKPGRMEREEVEAQRITIGAVRQTQERTRNDAGWIEGKG